MKTFAQCRFCKKELWLEVDQDYAGLGDPLKLLKLAACNHCADNRVEARRLHDRINENCSQLFAFFKDEEVRKTVRENLTRLTKDYLRMISERVGRQELVWTEAIVDEFMSSPRYWPRHVKELWKMARQQQLAL